MNNEMVDPMPDSAAPPARSSRVRPGARSPRRRRTARPVPSRTPTSSPRTRPAITPRVTGGVAAARRVSPVSGTPALARANSGTMTVFVHGCHSRCVRSLAGTERAMDSCAATAYSGSGDCR